MEINKIGILYHPLKEPARRLASDIGDFLRAKGVATWEVSAWEGDRARAAIGGTDLLLTTGGDGTILHAVQVAAPAGTPIIGINLGKLGFMTELRAEETRAALSSVLDGGGWIDERSMVEAELAGKGGVKFLALNDVVAARGAIARLITIKATVDSEPLTTYRVDGVVVSTATGSTGYSLAAGGPILHPQSNNFVMLPISPHLCSAYSLVLPPEAVVGLKVFTMHEATLCIDGIINQPLEDGAVITVRRSSTVTRFLRVHPQAFYSNLEKKLKGKQESGAGGKG